jgi:DGQHR domain-containing protein
MLDYIYVPYLEVKQPIGSFYLTKLTWGDLLAIAAADIRKIEDETSHGDSFDSYLGIQRGVEEPRVKEIAQYVTTFDATFPTSIILAIPSKEYRFKGKKIDLQDTLKLDSLEGYEEVDNIMVTDNELRIRRSGAVASVLDGQHRIEGIRRAYGNGNTEKVFDLNVTIFVDLDIDDQAQIFSVINKAQTKVNKSLVYDLYEYARSRSPQKTSHDIVRALNRMEKSPFYKKIKILGKVVNKETETIAQAIFVELIMGYISANPMTDRDDIKKKRKISRDYDRNKYIFRDYFLDENDVAISKILWNYFTAVSTLWPKSWGESENGNILNKTTGIIALMRYLRHVYNAEKLGPETTIDDYMKYLKESGLQDGEFMTEKYIPGSSGQSKLFYDLKGGK